MSSIEDWRTAVDERTGRTYWYHRKTRESTWTRPKCFDTFEEESLDNNEVGYETLLRMLEGLGTPDVLVELLHDESPELQGEAVQLFLSCCVPSTVYYLAREQGAISGLLNIIMLSATDINTRRYALRCLCSMALNEKAADYFASDQGWVSVAGLFTKWPDLESGIIYILLLSLLIRVDSCASIITEDMVRGCKHWLMSRCGYLPDQRGRPPATISLSALHTHPSSEGVSLLSGGVLTMLTGASNGPGRDLPATLLLVLAGHCFHEEKYTEVFISISSYPFHIDFYIVPGVSLKRRDYILTVIVRSISSLHVTVRQRRVR